MALHQLRLAVGDEDFFFTILRRRAADRRYTAARTLTAPAQRKSWAKIHRSHHC